MTRSPCTPHTFELLKRFLTTTDWETDIDSENKSLRDYLDEIEQLLGFKADS